MTDKLYRQLEAICNNASVGLLVMDQHQQCIYMNPAAVDLTGFTLEEVKGQPLHDVIHHTRSDGSPYPLHECPIDRAFPAKLQETGEETFVHKDGHFYDVAFTASPMYDDGKPVGTVIEIRDITQRKRAEADLKQAFSLIESIASGTEDLIAAVDTEYRFLYFNDAYRRDFKKLWGRDIQIGTSLTEGMEPWPGEQRKAVELWHRALGGETFSTTAEFGPSTQQRLFYDVHFNPIKNAEGKIVGAAHILRDITEQHHFQEALRQSEERYRLIGRATNDVIRDWSLATNCLEWNEAGVELLQSQTQGSQSKLEDWLHRIHPDDSDRVIQGLRRAIDSGQDSWRTEYRFRRHDGSYAVFLDRCYISHDFEGKPYRVIGSMLDLTERREAEEAVRQSAEADAFRVALSDAIRPLPSPVDIQAEATRVLGEYLEASRTHYAEVTEDGQYGVVYADYHRNATSVVGRHRLDDYGSEVMDELRAGRTLIINNVQEDPRLTPEQSAATAALDIGAYVAIPLMKADRLVALLVAHHASPRTWLSSELTIMEETAERTWAAVERAHTEQALRFSEQRFRLLTDGIPHMVWLLDAEGNFEFVNRYFSAYTGVSEVPVDAKRFFETYVHPDDINDSIQAWVTAAKQRAPFSVEQRIRSASGEYRWFTARAEPQVDKETGRVMRWFATMTDVHKQKVAEETLRQNDRQKDEFLAMLAHELRNPLAAVRNIETLLRPKLHGDYEADRYVGILHRQTSTLCKLVDDLLDVSRITRGLIDLKQDRVLLEEVLHRALESVQALMDEKQHQVCKVVPQEPAAVIGDPVRLEQILVNLLTNAAKYTDAGGRITVSLTVRDDQALVSVKDSGIGMTPDIIQRVFTLFGQAERGLDRAQGGLGIGLTIAKNLVELHGGTIQAASDGIGQGAEFTVTLPLAPTQEVPSRADTALAAKDGRPKHVLLVEDSLDVAETMVLLLETLGHTVSVAHDGPSALATAKASAPDVILLDVGLPGMDGFEVAERLRKLPHLKFTVMAALTGYGQPSDRARAKAAGFDKHFVKPMDFEVLEAFINEA